MADNETQLTDKQRAFVDAYLNEANFVGAEAARIAGYAFPKVEASRLLSHPNVRSKIDSYFDTLKHEGLRNKNVRVQALTKTVEACDRMVAANAREAQRAIDAGESVPEAALDGYYERTVKISANGKTVTCWEFNKALFNERRATIDQIAKELGDYVQKQELTGKDGGPLQINMAEDAYDALMGDIENGIL